MENIFFIIVLESMKKFRNFYNRLSVAGLRPRQRVGAGQSSDGPAARQALPGNLPRLAGRSVHDRPCARWRAGQAAEKAGSARAVNVVLMGVLSKVLPGIELDAWKKAVEKCVPAKVIEINEKAFDLGRDM